MFIKLNQLNVDEPETNSDEPRPRAAQSASKKKLTESMSMYDQFSGKCSNIVISFDILSSVFIL